MAGGGGAWAGFIPGMYFLHLAVCSILGHSMHKHGCPSPEEPETLEP